MAKELIDMMPLGNYDLVIEPSAGNGSFSNILFGSHDNVLAFDLKPEESRIIEKNWFDFDFIDYTDRETDSRILVIGNPPFGRQNNLAVGFINHATESFEKNFSSKSSSLTIGFILPKSFKKESLLSRLNRHLKVRQVFDLPENAFLLGDTEVNVPCCFFIFDYAEEYSFRPVKVDPVGYIFVNSFSPDDTNILALQRVGGRAGTVKQNFIEVNKNSHYFIKVFDDEIFRAFCDLEKISSKNLDNTAGPRSLSKKDFIIELNKIVEKLRKSETF